MRKVKMLAALAVALLLPPVLFAQTPLSWAVNHTPAVNVAAVASKAAGTNSRIHVATSCSGSISTVAAQPAITLSLRDGATGAGTVLWSQTITCAITTPCSLSSPPINVAGTALTAMTCEWSAAPATNNFEVASLTGYSLGGP